MPVRDRRRLESQRRRGMAIGKPGAVQDDCGFGEVMTRQNLDRLRCRGFYGVGYETDGSAILARLRTSRSTGHSGHPEHMGGDSADATFQQRGRWQVIDFCQEVTDCRPPARTRLVGRSQPAPGSPASDLWSSVASSCRADREAGANQT
jgi:hypothetical protein